MSLERARLALKRESSALHIRLALANLLLSLFPIYSGNSIRALALRQIGFQIGKGTLFIGKVRILGAPGIEERLIIQQNCKVSFGCTFDLAGKILLEENVNIGPECMLITGTHAIGPQENRLGEMISGDIRIGKGTWLAARVTVCPGVTIGSGTIVGTGAVVTRDLPANCVCAGVPAHVIRELDSPSQTNHDG